MSDTKNITYQKRCKTVVYMLRTLGILTGFAAYLGFCVLVGAALWKESTFTFGKFNITPVFLSYLSTGFIWVTVCLLGTVVLVAFIYGCIFLGCKLAEMYQDGKDVIDSEKRKR